MTSRRQELDSVSDDTGPPATRQRRGTQTADSCGSAPTFPPRPNPWRAVPCDSPSPCLPGSRIYRLHTCNMTHNTHRTACCCTVSSKIATLSPLPTIFAVQHMHVLAIMRLGDGSTHLRPQLHMRQLIRRLRRDCFLCYTFVGSQLAHSTSPCAWAIA